MIELGCRHKCIVHIRDNYPNIFEQMSISSPKYNLTNYMGYNFRISHIRGLLDLPSSSYNYDDDYIVLYTALLSKKDILEKYESELLWHKL